MKTVTELQIDWDLKQLQSHIAELRQQLRTDLPPKDRNEKTFAAQLKSLSELKLQYWRILKQFKIETHHSIVATLKEIYREIEIFWAFCNKVSVEYGWKRSSVAYQTAQHAINEMMRFRANILIFLNSLPIQERMVCFHHLVTDSDASYNIKIYALKKLEESSQRDLSLVAGYHNLANIYISKRIDDCLRTTDLTAQLDQLSEWIQAKTIIEAPIFTSWRYQLSDEKIAEITDIFLKLTAEARDENKNLSTCHVLTKHYFKAYLYSGSADDYQQYLHHVNRWFSLAVSENTPSITSVGDGKPVNNKEHAQKSALSLLKSSIDVLRTTHSSDLVAATNNLYNKCFAVLNFKPNDAALLDYAFTILFEAGTIKDFRRSSEAQTARNYLIQAANSVPALLTADQLKQVSGLIVKPIPSAGARDEQKMGVKQHLLSANDHRATYGTETEMALTNPYAQPFSTPYRPPKEKNTNRKPVPVEQREFIGPYQLGP